MTRKEQELLKCKAIYERAELMIGECSDLDASSQFDLFMNALILNFIKEMRKRAEAEGMGKVFEAVEETAKGQLYAGALDNLLDTLHSHQVQLKFASIGVLIQRGWKDD